jgi:hypothetical protein
MADVPSRTAIALDVEGQAFLGAAGQEVEARSAPPKESSAFRS